MILYHGSYTEVKTPDLNHSRKNVDFGPGFYTTPLYEQAEKWSEKFGRKGMNRVISVFEADENDLNRLNQLRFDSYSEDWLDFIMTCRSGLDQSDYDLVAGGVANDRVFDTVQLYFDGLITKEEALGRLKYQQPNFQYAFRTPDALALLKFNRSIVL